MFGEKVERVKETFEFGFDVVFGKDTSKSFVGELFTTTATGVNPIVLGGAVAVGAEKAVLIGRGLGLKDNLVTTELKVAGKETLKVFDPSTRQGKITFTVAALGALVPAVIKVSQPKVILEGVTAKTARITKGSEFFEVTEAKGQIKFGKELIEVDAASVIRGAESPDIPGTVGFIGEAAAKTSKGAEVASKIIGVAKQEKGFVESLIGQKIKTKGEGITETATVAKTETIIGPEGLDISRSVLTEFEVVKDVFTPKRVGFAGDKEILRVSGNDLLFQQFKSAEALVSGKKPLEIIGKIGEVSKSDITGILPKDGIGLDIITEKISLKVPTISKISLEATIKQAALTDVKPSAVKPAPVVVEATKDLDVSLTAQKQVSPLASEKELFLSSPAKRLFGKDKGESLQPSKFAGPGGAEALPVFDVVLSPVGKNVLSEQLILKREAVLESSLRKEAVLEGVLKKEAVLEGVLKREAVLEGVLKKEAVLEGVLKKEVVLEGVLKRDTILEQELLTRSLVTSGRVISAKRTALIPPVVLPFILPKKSLGPDIFSVAVRRRGVFEVVGEGLAKRRAISLGVGVAAGSSVASFKLLKGSKTVSISGEEDLLGGRFRKSKKDPNIFVELSKFRINTPGELEEITFKGLRALKFRSGLL